MAELTVGEPIKGYRPVDQDTAQSLQKKAGPSTAKKVAHKSAIASFVASLGLLGASFLGHGPKDVAQDTTSIAADAASHTAEEMKDRVTAFENTWKNGTPDPNDPRNR